MLFSLSVEFTVVVAVVLINEREFQCFVSRRLHGKDGAH